ncbi:MAG: O-methyltransferase [Bacteroidales bacterium]
MGITNKINNYLKYKNRSINKHKVHSPFVFRLITEVFEDNNKYSDYIKLLKLQNQLNTSHRLLETCDFGSKSGNKNYISYSESVATLNKKRSLRNKDLFLVYRLVKDIAPQKILELGTSFGVSTLALKLASPKSSIYTIEGCANIVEIAQESFKQFNINDIEVINGSFDIEIPQLLNKIQEVDFVLIDGNHRKEATLKYFRCCLEHINDNSCIIIDDISWSKQMREAWIEICKNPKVSITIDLFHMGIVFFRKGIPKQNFILKADY